ncbi:probable cytochrome P450 310a1 [Musca vetustissima]|uniref:probable cytochrome P450 310a1 n=1 Tax=Musca vetustissima TaxID=27455 RepID=UPI002AB68EC3|nr:probable cytochrome P450 310a1 [Musca vetustissima]
MWLLIPILVYSLIFLYVRHIYSYWRRKGFPHENASLRWSFLRAIYQREFHYNEAINSYYEVGKERFVGIYCFFRPILMIRDLSLARTLMENQAGHFNDTRWDYIRSYRKYNLLEKLSPLFANSRLEAMFRNVEKVSDHLVNKLNSTSGSMTTAAAASIVASAADSDYCIVDMQQLLRIYAVNIIANLIYGLDIDVFKQTDSVFLQYSNSSFQRSGINSYTFSRLPKKSSLTYRLRDIVQQNVELREDGATIRKDVMQLLVKFRNGNDIEVREKFNWHIENVFEREKVISIKKVARIAEYLLENGITTIASTAVFTLYEILKQPELMEKVRNEINAAKAINGINEKQQPSHQLSYEQLKQMKLLDLCIQETTRKYPSVPTIERTCRKPYAIPNSKRTLNDGKSFVIPLLAIQRDGKYFQDPLAYKPQRFLHDSNGNPGEKFTEFGLGAKTCIAQNFVKLTVKQILVKLFSTYQMKLMPMSDFSVCYDDTPYIRSADGLRVGIKS